MNSFLEERDTPDYDSLMSLAEQIVIRLPGCDDEMVRKAISSVYRDYVKRACIFKTRRVITASHDVAEYHVCPRMVDCDVDCIVGVYINDIPLRRDRCRAEGDRIWLSPIYLPSVGKTVDMAVDCLEVPRMGTERAPSMFVRRHGDAIVSGVLWRLMAMSGKPWSDGQQAAMEAVEYENALTEQRMRYHGDGVGGANYFKRGLIL